MAGPFDVLRAPVLLSKTANDSDDLFQFAFGFIPTINVGSALRIEDPVTRFLFDAVLDPLNFLEPFTLTKFGKTLTATSYLSRARKLREFEKVVNAAHLAKKEPGIAGRLLEAARKGDVRTLGRHADLFDTSLPEVRKFFSGGHGRAIQRAIALGEDLPDIAIGAAEQATKGHRALLKARIPFTDIEATLIRGEGSFTVLEHIPGLRWLGKVGQKDIQAFDRALGRSRASIEASEAAGRVDRALGDLASASPRIGGRIAEVRPAHRIEEAISGVRRAAAELEASELAAGLAHDSPVSTLRSIAVKSRSLAADLVLKGAESLPRVSTFIGRLASTVEPAAATGTIAEFLNASVNSLETLRPALKRVAPSLARVVEDYQGALLEAAQNPSREVELSGRAALRRIIEADFPRIAAKERLAKVPLTPTAKLTSRSLAAQREALRGLRQALDDLPEDAVPRVESIAAKEHALSQKLEALASRLPTVLDAIRVESARVSKIARAGVDVRRADLAIEALFAEAKTISNYLRSGGAKSVEVGNALEKELSRLFPSIVRPGVPAKVPVSLEEHALADDLVAGLSPSAARDLIRRPDPSFGGRPLASTFGVDFSPATLTDQLFGYKNQMRARLTVLIDKLGPVIGRLDEKTAINLIESFEDVEKLKALPKDLRAASGVLGRLFRETDRIGHGRWWEQSVRMFFPRVTAPSVGQAGRSFGEKWRILAANARRTSRHANERNVKMFRQLLEGEALGGVKVEKNPVTLIRHYFENWIDVAANQRLVDTLARNRTLEGTPILARASRFPKLAGKLGFETREVLDRYLSIDGRQFPALAGMRIHKDFAFVLDFFGPQTVTGAIRETNSTLVRNLATLNLRMKGALFSVTQFHTVTLLRSMLSALGPRDTAEFLRNEAKQVKLQDLLGRVRGTGASSRLLELWGEGAERIEFALAHGFEFDTYERFSQKGFQTFLEQARDVVSAAERKAAGASSVGVTGPGGPWRLLRSPITKLIQLNDLSQTVTWEYMHGSGKLYAWSVLMERAMAAHPEIPIESLAKQVSSSTNAFFGGLGWSKLFGNARARAGIQAFLLAPDWTVSNAFVARDALLGMFWKELPRDAAGRFPTLLRDVSSPTVAGEFARRYWMNAGLAIFSTVQLVNLALTGGFTWDNPGEGVSDKLSIWTGKRDPTNGKPIFVRTARELQEPLLFAENPLDFLRRRTAPFLRAVSGLVVNRDAFGQPIVLPEDSPAVSALKAVGEFVEGSVPISISQIAQSAERIATGQNPELEAANILTSQLDIRFARGRVSKEESRRLKRLKELARRQRDLLQGNFDPQPAAFDRSLVLERQTR